MTNDHLKMQDHVVIVGEVVAERYEITKHLGTGGFAKVFRAFDRVIERDVAIKFLDLRGVPGGGSMVGTVLERFRREAKLAAKIPHRNVVNIYDIGQLDDQGFRPYIVMELLEGHDLEDQLNHHGPIRPERLLPLFVDCLDALGDAHDLGIVHKDLKPSNLFLSNPGVRAESLRIVDFGIAHIKGTSAEEHETTESSSRLTATGQILGTLQYLTPEYIATQTVSPALDVYQMALILVELLSGERVIDTDNAFECLRIHTFGLLEIPEYLLASPLADVLNHALDADHHARYANAKIFADELSKVNPSSVPASPSFSNNKVPTRALASTISSPSLSPPKTGDHHRPTTDGFDAPLTSELEQGRPPDEISRHPDLGTRHQPLRAVANHGDTSSTSLGELAATVTSHEMVTLDDMEEPLPADQGSGKLFAALGLIGLLIVLAGGALTILMNKPAEQPVGEKPLIAADVAPRPPVEVTPPVEIKPAVVLEPLDTLTAPPVDAVLDKPVIQNVPVVDSVKSKKNLYPRYNVTLTTTPSDATISIDGKNLMSPAIVSIPEGQKQGVRVQVSRKGYVSEAVNVSRARANRTVALKRKEVKTPLKKDPVSKPPRDQPIKKEPRKATLLD